MQVKYVNILDRRLGVLKVLLTGIIALCESLSTCTRFPEYPGIIDMASILIGSSVFGILQMSLCSKSGIEEVGGERAGDTRLRRRWETSYLAYMFRCASINPFLPYGCCDPRLPTA